MLEEEKEEEVEEEKESVQVVKEIVVVEKPAAKVEKMTVLRTGSEGEEVQKLQVRGKPRVGVGGRLGKLVPVGGRSRGELSILGPGPGVLRPAPAPPRCHVYLLS